MEQQIVTVFGGSGFIGRHVISKLARNGAIIRVAVRDTERALPLKVSGEVGQIIPWATDITKPEHIATAVEGATQVINLVGIMVPGGNNSFDQIHHISAGNIAELSTKAGVNKLVHMSALGADPESPSKYARTKALGEEAVKKAFPAATVIRPGVVFGAEDKFFNLFAGLQRFTPFMPVIGAPAFPKISWSGGETPIDIDFFGNGGPKFQPVFVDDVADAIIKCLNDDHAAGETYQLGGPEIYSFKTIMEMVMKFTGRSRILYPLPYGMATVIAWFLQKLPNPLLTCDQITLMQTDNIVATGAKTFNDLGIQPTSAPVILPTYLKRFRAKPSASEITA